MLLFPAQEKSVPSNTSRVSILSASLFPFLFLPSSRNEIFLRVNVDPDQQDFLRAIMHSRVNREAATLCDG